MNYKLAFIGKVEILVRAPKYGPMPKTKNVFFFANGLFHFLSIQGYGQPNF